MVTLEELGGVQVRSTECGTGASPKPDNPTEEVLPEEELLATVSSPVTDPVATGANLMVSGAVAPGFSTIGNVPATMEKPVPVVDPDDIVTAAVPVDDSVTVPVAESPTVTEPRFKLAGLNPSFGLGATVPVPLREIVEVAPVAELLSMVSLPATAPAVWGSNAICRVSDWPADKVMGTLLATIEKPVPVIERELTVTAAVPDDFNVRGRSLAVPSVTLP